MKRVLIFAMLCLLGTTLASAGLRFGLGNAVAKRSSDLINQAGASQNLVGDNVANTLSSCPQGAVFDTPPTDMSMIGGIDPLGHVQPTGHTFPADHIYYYSSTTTVYTPPVYAPGAIHVTEIDSSENLSAVPVFKDYSVTFYPCQQVRAYYGHVQTLSSTLLGQAGSINQNCNTYTTGGNTFRSCAAYTNITMASGDLIGYMRTSSALDFGASDSRVSLFYVSPQRRGPNDLDTVCPIDYFTAGPKATMQAKLGRFDGGYRRVTPPICGTIVADVANTAKGYWYHPGSPNNPEDPHLSLIDNNVYAPQQTISVGNSLPNGGGLWYIFTPVSGAGQFVDRNFSEVSSDGNIYCYDTFFDPIGQPVGLSAPKFILQMLTPTTLRFEKQGTGSCGSGPWAFTGNSVDFQR